MGIGNKFKLYLKQKDRKEKDNLHKSIIYLIFLQNYYLINYLVIYLIKQEKMWIITLPCIYVYLQEYILLFL